METKVDIKEIEKEAEEEAKDLLEAGASKLCLNREAFAHLVANLICPMFPDDDVSEVAFCKACDVWDETGAQAAELHVVIHPAGGEVGIKLFEADLRARVHVREAIAEIESGGKAIPNVSKFPFTSEQIEEWNKNQSNESYHIIRAKVN